MKIPSPIIVSCLRDDAAGGSVEEKIALLPITAGVFCVEVNGRVSYLSSAPNLRRRVARTMAKLSRFTGAGEHHSIAVHCWESSTKLHTSLLLYQLAKEHFPEDYLQRVHLRMPWFVALLTRDPFPRLLLTNRIPAGCEPVVGPFGRRDMAQLYEQEVQSAFFLRRCTDVLEPHPEHPGCIYGEMKQCLRPCQCAVEPSRYLSEAAEVSVFLRENGSGTIREKTKARDEAIGCLDFELAAQIHRQLEKLKNAKSARDPVVTSIDSFHGAAVVREGKSGWVQLLPMVQGRWCEPVRLLLSDDVLNGTGVEDALRAQLNPVRLEDEASRRDTLEDLALFARWYYSSWREGLWTPFPRLEDPPFRKIARSVRNLVKQAPAIQT